MFSRTELLALSTLLLQALAHPAPAGELENPENYLNSELELLYSEAFAYQPSQSAVHPSAQLGGGPDDHCGGGGGNGGHGGGGGSGYPGPTVTVTGECPPAPTATVTITTDAGGNGIGTITVTDTTTDTISQCTATITDDNLAPTTVTETETDTETDTLTSTISECTATTTDYTTLTTDGPTITQTVTTAGPTENETITETQGAETVTAPGSTETEIVTTTLTNEQIITSTETSTETQTLEVTKTVTSDDCGETGTDGGGLDYGTCSDPTINWLYGLDNRTDYSYTTNNQKDFPFGSDPSIQSPEALICNNLRSPCNAPQATLDKCAEAQKATAGLTGQNAADVWNEMMT